MASLRGVAGEGGDRIPFLLNLHRFGVAAIDLREDELRSDLENA